MRLLALQSLSVVRARSVPEQSLGRPVFSAVESFVKPECFSLLSLVQLYASYLAHTGRYIHTVFAVSRGERVLSSGECC